MKKHSLTIEILGWLGMGILISAYTLNSFGVIASQGIIYPFLNLIAAILLGIRVYADKNYANTVLELFWGGVACISLIQLLF